MDKRPSFELNAARRCKHFPPLYQADLNLCAAARESATEMLLSASCVVNEDLVFRFVGTFVVCHTGEKMKEPSLRPLKLVLIEPCVIPAPPNCKTVHWFGRCGEVC